MSYPHDMNAHRNAKKSLVRQRAAVAHAADTDAKLAINCHEATKNRFIPVNGCAHGVGAVYWPRVGVANPVQLGWHRI
ncbi:MAG TPA: hypothetical protein VG122_15920 [Gemmata sp.]|nr:hypothetical protein [Gemmata sp.]